MRRSRARPAGSCAIVIQVSHDFEDQAGARPAKARKRRGAWLPEELVARCLAHEEGAWQEFLARYARLIHAIIHRMGLPEAEREEAFQSAVAAIYAQLPGLRDVERLVPWIASISSRQAVNCIRRRPKEIPWETGLTPGRGDSVEPPARDPLPDETLLELERAQQAQEAMAALSARCRRLLGYFFYSEPQPGYAEIARRERIPIGSLGPTRARCLSRMRRYFKERGWL